MQDGLRRADSIVKTLQDIFQPPGNCLAFQFEVGGQVAGLDREIVGQHGPALYLLGVRQAVVDLADQAVDALPGVRVQDFTLDPQQGDAVRPFLADQHRFSHAGDLPQERFYLCRLDIFPVGGFEELFLASFQDQAAFRREAAQVAG